MNNLPKGRPIDPFVAVHRVMQLILNGLPGVDDPRRRHEITINWLGERPRIFGQAYRLGVGHYNIMVERLSGHQILREMQMTITFVPPKEGKTEQEDRGMFVVMPIDTVNLPAA